MDKDSQEIFDQIVKSNPQDLTFRQRQFLNARRDYLNDEQKRIFADILNQTKTDETPEVDTELKTVKEEVKETLPEDKIEDVFGDK